jgi:pilus assembly protein Flp/PilA
MAKFLKLFKNEDGATAIEYGLIAALIAVAIISAVTAVGGSLTTTFEDVSAGLADAGTAGEGTTP